MRWWGLLLLASCGRYGFDGVAGSDDSQGSGSSDAGDDGQTGDGAIDDGASPDGTTAILDCTTSSVFLCDTFEQTSLDTGLWVPQEFNGSVVIDDAMAHRGARSFHSTIVSLPAPPGNSVAHAVHVATLPAHVFIRVFARHHGTPSGGAMYLNAYSVGGPNNTVELRNVTGSLVLDSYNPANTHTTSVASFPADTWRCIELELDGLPPTGSAMVAVRVYVEGVELMELRQNVQLAATVDRLAVGMVDRSITDSWIDDLIVDTQRVGCTK